MSRWLSGLAWGCVLGFSLGCSSVGTALMELSGTEMDRKTGEDAVHPEDFGIPVPPVEVTLTMSMDVVVAGVDTRTVVYEGLDPAHAAEVLAFYKADFEGRGFEVEEREEHGQHMMVGEDGPTVYMANVQDDQLTLTVVVTEAAHAQ